MELTNMELLQRIANMEGGPEYDGTRKEAQAALNKYKRWEAIIGFTEETRKSGIVANKSYGVAESDYFLQGADKLKEAAKKKAGSSPTIGYKTYGPNREV